MMMGFIAAHDKTTVAMLAFPGNNENVKTKTAFNIEVHYANGGGLGVFTDAQKNYGNTPMLLNKNGETFGHNHVTVQKIDDPTKPAPATNFTFFKGINFAVQNINGQQVHQVLVPNGLDKGNYRCCTILGGISHFASEYSWADKSLILNLTFQCLFPSLKLDLATIASTLPFQTTEKQI